MCVPEWSRPAVCGHHMLCLTVTRSRWCSVQQLDGYSPNMTTNPVSQTCCPSSSSEAWSRDMQTQPSPCCIRSETDTSWHLPRTSRQWREFSPALTHIITYSTRQIPWYSGIHSTRTSYDFGTCFLTPWPWLCRPMPSGIGWAKRSTRPETNLPPSQEHPLALPVSYAVSPLYMQGVPSIQLITLLSN